MSSLYLIRHGQAGTRERYDSLSELGRRQTRLLGEHFVAQGIRFEAVQAGGMNRQLESAMEVAAAYGEAGIPFPEIQQDGGWNEFDLDGVTQGLAPLMCADDPEFLREYEAMLEEIRASQGEHSAAVHRRWFPCDTKIMEAWMAGRYRFDGESWPAFCTRIADCRRLIDAAGADADVAIFTSAMPTAIWAGLSLDITDDRVTRMAGVLYNASYTLMRLRGEQLRMMTFNATPHLEPSLRTHR